MAKVGRTYSSRQNNIIDYHRWWWCVCVWLWSYWPQRVWSIVHQRPICFIVWLLTIHSGYWYIHSFDCWDNIILVNIRHVKVFSDRLSEVHFECVALFSFNVRRTDYSFLLRVDSSVGSVCCYADNHYSHFSLLLFLQYRGFITFL